MKTKIFILMILMGLVVILFAAPGNESVTLTRQSENRKNSKYPIWDAIVTATHDVNDTEDVTQAVIINGTIQKVILTVPSFTNAITGQVVIKDNEDRTIFDSGEQTRGATYAFSLSEPVTGTIDVVLGISGAPGGSGGSIIAVLRGE